MSPDELSIGHEGSSCPSYDRPPNGAGPTSGLHEGGREGGHTDACQDVGVLSSSFRGPGGVRGMA